MKVVHVLNHFLPHHIAGTEIYTEALVIELLNMGVDALVLIPNYGKNLTEYYFHKKIRVIKYAESSTVDRSLIMGLSKPSGLQYFEKILQEEKPDIVHFHELAGSNGITVSHVLAAKEAGFKVVMTFHLSSYSCKTGNLMYKDKVICDGIIDIKKCTSCYFYVAKENAFFSTFLTPVSNLIYKTGIDVSQWNNKIGTALGFPFVIQKLKNNLLMLASNSDKIVVLTDWYKKILLSNKIPPNKINVIKQALPISITSEAKKKVESKLGFRIIFIGRISRFKGIHLLISALKGIKGNVQLDIYGQDCDSKYTAECKALCVGMNNIFWMGTVQPKDVISIIAQHDILCLPSTSSEMSPLVIQEAFAVNTPVVASNVYGNAEQIVDGENGWLFNFKDSNSLGNVIQRLVDNPNLITEAKAKIPIVKVFSTVAYEYIKLYEELMVSV
jgi:glycosyltransferase involved in cell wall biosynthesis